MKGYYNISIFHFKKSMLKKFLFGAAELIFSILSKLWDDCAIYEAGFEADLWEKGWRRRDGWSGKIL